MSTQISELLNLTSQNVIFKSQITYYDLSDLCFKYIIVAMLGRFFRYEEAISDRCLNYVRYNFRFRANRGNFKIVRPGKVSPQKQVPQSIPKPSYHVTGEPTELIFKPEIKNGDKLARMRESCKLAAEILRKAGEFVEVSSPPINPC